jgi:hypothetical protein
MVGESSRVRTTHVGSPPRSATVTEMPFRREQGEPYSKAEFDTVMARSVDEVVARHHLERCVNPAGQDSHSRPADIDIKLR